MEQNYDGGLTVGKIIKPIKMEGIKTIIDSRELIGSTETVISSTERIISPLEAKTVMGGISSGEEEVIIYSSQPSQGEKFSIDREKWVIGNHDSAPRMYGATFSPIAIGGHVYAADPDQWYFDEMRKKLGKGLSGHIYQGEKHIITSESKGLLRNPEQ